MKVWECPKCGSTNNFDLAKCFCGYELQGREKEIMGQEQVKVAPLTEADIQRLDEEASEKIKFAAYILYIVAGLSIIEGFSFHGGDALGGILIIVGIIIAFLTVILHKFKSRIAAAILLIVPISMWLDSVMLISSNEAPRPSRIILSIVVTVSCFNAVIATFIYWRSKR